jgi:dihydrofolate reductase
MRRVTYSMSMSLDGYIVGPDGSFDWTGPVGGGIPVFPRRERRVDLELVETRTFSTRVVLLRYRVAR